jgi:hypothetical protein
MKRIATSIAASSLLAAFKLAQAGKPGYITGSAEREETL